MCLYACVHCKLTRRSLIANSPYATKATTPKYLSDQCLISMEIEFSLNNTKNPIVYSRRSQVVVTHLTAFELLLSLAWLYVVYLLYCA